MPDGRADIEAALIAGLTVDGIALSHPDQVRMLRFLLGQTERGGPPFADEYIQALKGALDGDAPSASDQVEDAAAPSRCWRLVRVEADGFGGLTAHGAGPFSLDLAGSFAVEGHNGQGKSSLAGAILCCLTGQHLGHLGPSPSPLRPANARAPDGHTVAWPPAVAYPNDTALLAAVAPRASLRLLFRSDCGAEHVSEAEITRDGWRGISGPPPGVPSSLIELALLAPNRIAHLRVGEETRLVDVVAEVIGLEPLRSLGEHAAALCDRRRNFAGEPKAAEVQRVETKVRNALRSTSKALAGSGILGLPDAETISTDRLFAEVAAAKGMVAERRRQAFDAAAEGGHAGIDTAEGQTKLLPAVGRMQSHLGDSAIGSLPTVRFLNALARFAREGGEAKLRAASEAAAEGLRRARSDLARHRGDTRLRLKAQAAHWHAANHPGAPSVEDCPLCGQSLAGDETLDALGREIAGLREEAGRLRETFADACRRLADDLRAAIPREIDMLVADPAAAALEEMASHVESSADLKAYLPWATAAAASALRSAAALLPPCPPLAFTAAPEPETAKLAALVHHADALVALAEWWPDMKRPLASARVTAIGNSDQAAPGSLLSELADLAALANITRPLVEADDYLAGAVEDARRLDDFRADEKARKRVVAALEPLKRLVQLVETRAKLAVEAVSESACSAFLELYGGHDDAVLQPKAAGVDRRSGALQVEGAFREKILVDASLVANTAWLRAFLWSFVFSLRRHHIHLLGHNPFPLLVLDDPQATFDPVHQRQWAQVLGDMACAGEDDHAQLFLTSHDPRFLRYLEAHGNFQGSRASVHGICKRVGTLRVMDGGPSERAWAAFDADRRPETARDYVAAVRRFLEDGLIVLLGAFGVEVEQPTFGKLLTTLEGCSSHPLFSTPALKEIVPALRGPHGFSIYVNDAHHAAYEATIGPADAEKVREAWSKARASLNKAFAEARRFELMGPRQLPTVAAAPASENGSVPAASRVPVFRTRVVRAPFAVSGRIAAASGGRVSTGDDADPDIQLPHHAAVALLADTLAPFAEPGDILLLRLHDRPGDGDLVVAEMGGRRLARRVRVLEGHGGTCVLVAESQAANPPPPVVTAFPLPLAAIIDGIVWKSGGRFRAPGSGGDGEVSELAESLDVLEAAGPTCYTWQVSGDSAEPIAADGQFVLVGPGENSQEGFSKLDGLPVVASREGLGEEAERYLKRLRWLPPVVILESLDANRHPPILCSLDGVAYPRLLAAAPLQGVLYKPAQARRRSGPTM